MSVTKSSKVENGGTNAAPQIRANGSFEAADIGSTKEQLAATASEDIRSLRRSGELGDGLLATPRPTKVSFIGSSSRSGSLGANEQLTLRRDSECTEELLRSQSNADWRDYGHVALRPENEAKSLTISIRDWSSVPRLSEVFVPLLFAGCGMMAAGMLLNHAQFWPFFSEIEEALILVPALCGAQGNVLLMLGSRLTTLASDGSAYNSRIWTQMAFANLLLTLARAIPAAFMATFAAMLLSVIKVATGASEDAFAQFSVAASLRTSAVLAVSASYTLCFVTPLLGSTVILLISFCRRFRHNPDAVVLPIVTSLGDLSTLGLLAHVGQAFYSLEQALGLGPILIALSVLGAFALILLLLAHRSVHTRHDTGTGWLPIIFSMAMSSCAGLVLARVSDQFVRFAVFQPIVSGVAGGLAAVQTSNISTRLHQLFDKPGCLVPRFLSPCPSRKQSTLLGVESSLDSQPAKQSKSCCSRFHNCLLKVVCSASAEEDDDYDMLVTSCCPNPYRTFFGLHTLARTNRLLCLSAIPAHVVCLVLIYVLNFIGEPFYSAFYIASYLAAIFFEAVLLLYVSNWLVQFLWKRGYDPDNSASPYVTAAGDILGSLVLAAVFGLVFLLTPADPIVELHTETALNVTSDSLNATATAASLSF